VVIIIIIKRVLLKYR